MSSVIRIVRAGLLLLVASALVAASAFAFQPRDAALGSQSHLLEPVHATRIAAQPDLAASTGLAALAGSQPGAAAFAAAYGDRWELRWDRRSDRPNLIQGSGIPLLPGRGNRLDNGAIGLAPAAKPTLADVAVRLRGFMDEQQALLKLEGLDLRLNETASTAVGDGDTHWFVRFDQYVGDVPVDEAYVFFRIAHGNIIQFGSERVAAVTAATKPALARDAAFDAAFAQLPLREGARIARVIEPGELILAPMLPRGAQAGTRFAGTPGEGYDHVLAWRFEFLLEDDPTDYVVLFDARENRLIEVTDDTRWTQATVSAGIYPDTHTDPEVVVPLPFVAVSNSGNKVTDEDGHYDYSGGTASTSLNGKYFRISDNCGAISLSDSSDGNLDFGTSGGTDCVTPGFGGAGNTHASRTGFYHLTMINQIARSRLPSNSWLQSKVTANMNINDVCNAYWQAGTLNFFKSGPYGSLNCANTGEIAGVFLHEWGHGVDSNTGGGSASEMGSGEAVGDTFAFLYTEDSCIGPGFADTPAVCHNCNTGCTGVRDVSAFSLDRPAGNVIARPDTVEDPNGIDADPNQCPYYQQGIFPYQGPMGYEGHDESQIASNATWDLLRGIQDEFGAEDGLEEMQRIWYASINAMKSAYQITSGGQCNPQAQVDGCGATNWYTVMLAADDDDGNLANGTPNGCRIWDAFEAHGIACGARPDCTSFGGPGFALDVADSELLMCAADSVQTTVSVSGQNGFADPVQLAVSGVPGGATATFAVNPLTPDASTTLDITGSAALAAGSYPLVVNGSAAGHDPRDAGLELVVSTAAPGNLTPQSPADGATDAALQPTLSWSAATEAVTYEVEIATDAAFTQIVASGTTSATSWSVPVVLDVLSEYWWRVRAVNGCGDSAWSAPAMFTTGQPFPEPYCAVNFSSSVEPITRVVLADIDNPSPVSSSDPHEDFTGVAGGDVENDASYDLRVEGTTAGNYKTYVSAYFDWDRDGSFSASEKVSIGMIENSTGSDGKHATAPIEVPDWVTPGPVRMRVLKKWSAEVADACNSGGSGYGQAEDYTLMVDGGIPTWSVGGNATGVAGQAVTLGLNGGETLVLTADGSFTFPTALEEGESYAVTIDEVRGIVECTLANASGVIAGADVDDVTLSCIIPTTPVDPDDLIFADGFDGDD